MSSRLICIDQYELQVEITYCREVPGDRSSWDSDWDYYGYRELEFEVVGGLSYDANGENPWPLNDEECAEIAERYADTIEEKLWAQLADEKEEYYE